MPWGPMAMSIRHTSEMLGMAKFRTINATFAKLSVEERQGVPPAKPALCLGRIPQRLAPAGAEDRRASCLARRIGHEFDGQADAVVAC